MKNKCNDVMVTPPKQLTHDGFERPACTKDDPFWFFRHDLYESSKSNADKKERLN